MNLMNFVHWSVFGAALISLAEPSPAQTQDSIVTTRHSITVRGRPLSYIARAGRLPIRDIETGEPHGHAFFTAYHVQQSPGARPRPLTFLWNGGPGSPASYVHLLGYGPRRVKTADVFPNDSRLYDEMTDNQETWLDQTDLVFIDPIGTGYSRVTKAEYGAEFYQDVGDAQSVAEFIRSYRQQFGLFDAPLVVGGESYGVSRAGRVADVLQRRGIDVAGIVLITYDLPAIMVPNDVRRALALPTYTAAGHYHKRLAPDLQGNLGDALAKSHKWSEEVYFPALSRRDSLTERERDDIIAQVARFTGLKPSQIDRRALAITSVQYSTQLLQEEGLVLGRYDSRFTRPANARVGGGTSGDPGLTYVNSLNSSSVLQRYFRNELGYSTDLSYAGASGQTFSTQRPAWIRNGEEPRAEAAARAKFGARGDTTAVATRAGNEARGQAAPFSDDIAPLRGALNANPKSKVFLICSYYDLGSNCIGDAFYAKWLGAPFEGRILTGLYFSMHMPYVDKSERVAMKRDFARFLQDIQR